MNMVTIIILFAFFGLTTGTFSLQAAPEATPKKSILVVSFGTTHPDALANAIEPIEKKIAEKFPQYEVSRAFTSRIVRKRLVKKGIIVHSPAQALEKLAARGIKEVYLQPLHIIPGAEFHEIVRTVQRFRNKFDTLKLGSPLLTHPEDFTRVAEILNEKYNRNKTNHTVILMGHGTHHPANSCYALLQTEIDRINKNLLVATVEGSLSLEHLLPRLPKPAQSPLLLAPFMLVAGDHAKNDMAGDEEDSWKQILGKKGFRVTTKLEGLGADPRFQEIFIQHLEQILKNSHE
jgi:sirohydrochlorin cobaltochelatase